MGGARVTLLSLLYLAGYCTEGATLDRITADSEDSPKVRGKSGVQERNSDGGSHQNEKRKFDVDATQETHLRELQFSNGMTPTGGQSGWGEGLSVWEENTGRRLEHLQNIVNTSRVLVRPRMKAHQQHRNNLFTEARNARDKYYVDMVLVGAKRMKPEFEADLLQFLEARNVKLKADLDSETSRRKKLELEKQLQTAQCPKLEAGHQSEQLRCTNFQPDVQSEEARRLKLEAELQSEHTRCLKFQADLQSQKERSLKLEAAIRLEHARCLKLEAKMQSEEARRLKLEKDFEASQLDLEVEKSRLLCETVWKLL
ncbi:hypothetical protein R1sor_003034 [Riccia sorocarpa]|uniref:Uncharacterized protein n=1 Tax=Riccia sorocarpa TaxID=122646 RepID=A0ABD3H3J3_9MARC